MPLVAQNLMNRIPAPRPADAADLLTTIIGPLLEQLVLPIDDFETARLLPAVRRFFPGADRCGTASGCVCGALPAC
jgi:hypothetical protein